MRQQTTAKDSVTTAREADAAGLDRPLPTFVVESPSRRVGWRVTGGTITRHAGGGPPTGETTTGDDLRAGMAWSDVEAWVVGARGAVWRTANGDTWTRVPFPGAQTLVRVDVSGPGTATVTTETGDRLTTTDAGRTWTPAPPAVG